MSFKCKKYTITENHTNKRIDRVIRSFFPDMPMSAVYKNLRTKNIKLNGNRAKENMKVKEGDILEIYIKDDIQDKPKDSNGVDYKKLKESPFFKKNFKVLFEDKDILVLDKPAGVAVHPGTDHYHGRTMLDLARAHTGECDFPPTLVHRLDLGTSGVLLFAKNNLSLQNLNKQMKEKSTTKKYYALVNGNIKEDKGTIKVALERTQGNQKSTKIIISKGGKNAKMSITHFEVVKRFGDIATLISVTLETGRMHQIRVHMKSQSHELWGDEHYGDFNKNREISKNFGLKRIFLHSYFLEFTHPKTEKKIKINSELPEELENVLNKLDSEV